MHRNQPDAVPGGQLPSWGGRMQVRAGEVESRGVPQLVRDVLLAAAAGGRRRRCPRAERVPAAVAGAPACPGRSAPSLCRSRGLLPQASVSAIRTRPRGPDRFRRSRIRLLRLRCIDAAKHSLNGLLRSDPVSHTDVQRNLANSCGSSPITLMEIQSGIYRRPTSHGGPRAPRSLELSRAVGHRICTSEGFSRYDNLN